jgi:hypothetical protein
LRSTSWRTRWDSLAAAPWAELSLARAELEPALPLAPPPADESFAVPDEESGEFSEDGLGPLIPEVDSWGAVTLGGLGTEVPPVLGTGVEGKLTEGAAGTFTGGVGIDGRLTDDGAAT